MCEYSGNASIDIDLVTTLCVSTLYSGVIAKQYKEIREGIHTIVVKTLFDPLALKEHFSGRKKYIQEMLHLGRLSKPRYSCITKILNLFCHLEHHFGSLLNSEAANRIIERKINLALARPEGTSMVGS